MNNFKSLLAIFLFFSVFSLIIFFPIFLGKVNLNGNLLVSFYPVFGENLPFKNTGWDQLRIYFPFYKVTLDAIKGGQIPLWNPFAFSGHPHMADFQTAVFYPLNIFGLILGQVELWHLLRITPTILASVFTFLYLRSLKLSKLAAFFGAFTFGFSPFILTWGEEVVMSVHSIIWLPLILWGVEKYLDLRSKKYLAVISLATAFSFFGGYMQTTIYVFLFVLIYLGFRLWETGLRSTTSVKGLKIVAAMVLGAGIAALQLFPSAELYFHSARAQIALKETLFNFLLPLETLITYLAPDFFGNPATGNYFRMGGGQYYEGILFVGIAALIFALYALLRSSEKSFGRVKFLAIFGLICTSTAFYLPTSKLFLSLPIPFLSTSIANRILFISAFCIATLGAIGVEKWFLAKDKKILKTVFWIGTTYLVIIALIFVFKIFNLNYFEHANFKSAENIAVSLRNLVIPLGIFVLSGILIFVGTMRPKLRRMALVLVIFIGALNIFYFSKKYFSFTERKYIFPELSTIKFIRENQDFYRSWGAGDALLENNFATQYGLFSAGGYDSLNNRDYAKFTYAMQGARLADFVSRADAGLGIGSAGELLANQNRRRLIDMVGVKYVTARDSDTEIMKKNNFIKVFDGGNFNVWENLEVLPRAFLASNYEGPPDVFGDEPTTESEVVKREKERRELIPSKLLSDGFDWRNVLVLEKPSPISAQFGEGSAQITKYEPQEVVIKTSSKQPKLLFLSDNYYPGWKATVDGDETPILRANYTFRAVPVNPGDHEVRFYYDPWTFKFGLLVSVFSLGLLAYFTLVKNRLVG